MSLKKLNGQLRTAKKTLASFKSYLAGFDGSDRGVTQLVARLKVFEPVLQTYYDITEQISELSDTQTEEQSEERREFENEYFESIATATDIVAANRTHPPVANPEPPANSLIGAIKLPAIQLPTFSGKIDEWTSFFDTFHSLIGTNIQIAPAQKLQYLKGALTSDALNVIRCLEVSDANYESAVALLKERYDNTRSVITSHVRAILNLPSANKESVGAIRAILDGTVQHVQALESLNRPTQAWDDLLLVIVAEKLDPITRREWETRSNSREMPPFAELRNFLALKCQALESIQSAKQDSEARIKTTKNVGSYAAANFTAKCNFCRGPHTIFKCDTFARMTIDERREQVKTKQLCFNCVRPSHTAQNCPSGGCKTCGCKHHTLLHKEAANHPVSTVSTCQTTHAQVLLSTCVVKIEDANKHEHTARLLLDPGSEISIMTAKLANRLGLAKRTTKLAISGVGGNVTHSNYCVDATIKARNGSYATTNQFFILDKITSSLPINSFNPNLIKIPNNIQLADPQFFKSREIDLLIGAELFYELLCVGQFRTNQRGIIFQKTRLGYVLSGKMPTGTSQSANCNLSVLKQLNNNIQKFWEIESESAAVTFNSPEEERCVAHFDETYKRDPTGRFVLALPFRESREILGGSRAMAENRLFATERRLAKNVNLRKEYVDFMNEYLKLGHMREVRSDPMNDRAVYLPHHFVEKITSQTTRLRVVFDASAKTSSGLSLNDALLKGPVIQDDIFSLLLRFRTHQIALMADVAKMYRQINIRAQDTPYQRILWRFDPAGPIKTFELNTVTYGLTSSSYQATRCLMELAKAAESSHPTGAAIIKTDMYMDDLITGADSVDAARIVRDEVGSIMKGGQFELRKWAANERIVLHDLAEGACEKHLFLNRDGADEIRALGVVWDPQTDCFQYQAKFATPTERCTKRSILSLIASIFDPIGILGPITVCAKILMQSIWSRKLAWDEAVPLDIHTDWQRFITQLTDMRTLSIPRKIIHEAGATLELHGFADASSVAYAACVYVKSYGRNHSSCVLACGKSRVAPLKTISLPRLELCAAVLLSNLMVKVRTAMKRELVKIRYYSDSTIALHWIRNSPSKWTTFVANRVSLIQSITDVNAWSHVQSADNPSDVLSRGCSPAKLADHNLYWYGPNFIHEDGDESQLHEVAGDLPDEIPETKGPSARAFTMSIQIDFFHRFSKLSKLLRVTAWIKRFADNTNIKIERRNGPLHADELEKARKLLLRAAQQEAFAEDVLSLQREGRLANKSRLLTLAAYLDPSGLLRVGGRLNNSQLTPDAKHPVVLSSNHPLTKLIIRDEHIKHFHAGEQATSAAIRSRYWIIRSRNAVRKVIRECVTCFKARPHITAPRMAHLPSCRTIQTRAFQKTGVDFCGPIWIREGSRKSKRRTKAYIAVFVCMTTKAVHLEPVSSLTTDAFIAALRRFIARRGLVSHLFSDNGTNFVGAKHQLRELHHLLAQNDSQAKIENELSGKGIQWVMIPPGAPHYGGLWEAAVKSCKLHLHRVAGEASLTFEELATLLTQIECVLNSRPLTPLSNDPNDLSYLTPSHFLIGTNAGALPEEDLQDVCSNRLSRWQRVQQIYSHYWSRWHREYLTELQKRHKWKTSAGTPLQVGQLVLIREQHLPPMQWRTGRIVALHNSADGIARSADVQTRGQHIIKRAARYLCVLPIEQCDQTCE